MPVGESIDLHVFSLSYNANSVPHIVCVTALRNQQPLYGRRRANNTGILNIQTRQRNHDVDEDEAVVCRSLVETPFDIETSGFTYVYTLAAA